MSRIDRRTAGFVNIELQFQIALFGVAVAILVPIGLKYLADRKLDDTLASIETAIQETFSADATAGIDAPVTTETVDGSILAARVSADVWSNLPYGVSLTASDASVPTARRVRLTLKASDKNAIRSLERLHERSARGAEVADSAYTWIAFEAPRAPEPQPAPTTAPDGPSG